MKHSHQHSHAGHDHDHHHGHGCAHGVKDTRRLLIAFLIIISFMVLEVAGGIISGSLALLADAAHMATDAAALLLALSAKWLADKKPRQSHLFPFGFQRAQVLAGFLNGVGLLVLVAWLIWESIHRIMNPREIMTGLMLAVAIVGLAANCAAFAVLHSGNTKDLNMRGAMLHVMGDIFGSIAAIMSAIIISLTGWVAVDAVLTVLVSALIVRSAMPLLSEASHILLQGAPRNFNPREITARLEAVDGVRNVHHLQMWMLTPEEPQLAMHVRVDDPAKAQPALEKIKKLLTEEYQITQSTIQVECPGCPDDLQSDPAFTISSGGQGTPSGDNVVTPPHEPVLKTRPV